MGRKGERGGRKKVSLFLSFSFSRFPSSTPLSLEKKGKVTIVTSASSLSSATISAAAPAFSALEAFSMKKQSPRSTSAITGDELESLFKASTASLGKGLQASTLTWRISPARVAP